MRIGQSTAYNGQTDEFNVLRYGEAVDDLLDRINEGVEVVVTSTKDKDKLSITYATQPAPGTYRLVSWDTGGGE